MSTSSPSVCSGAWAFQAAGRMHSRESLPLLSPNMTFQLQLKRISQPYELAIALKLKAASARPVAKIWLDALRLKIPLKCLKPFFVLVPLVACDVWQYLDPAC